MAALWLLSNDSSSFLLFKWNIYKLKPAQVGDVAVLDVSAMTIEQDGSAAQSIPSAESKGLC